MTHITKKSRKKFFNYLNKTFNDYNQEESEEEQLKPACIDLTDYKLKIDHFDQMHVLPDENRVDGSDNFRQVRVVANILTLRTFRSAVDGVPLYLCIYRKIFLLMT